jgi:acyl dehydratase
LTAPAKERDKGLLAEGKITPEGVQRLLDLRFTELRRPFILNTEITFDAVRRYCWGIGDGNPLFLEPGYAESAGYPSMVAPTGLLNTTHPGYVPIGLPGVHGLHAGTTWKLFSPIKVGTVPVVTCWLDRIEERESKFGGNTVWVYTRTVYADQTGNVLAESTSYTIRSERAKSRKKAKFAGREMRNWSLAEITALEDEILAKTRRGAQPRYWEDVKVGDTLDELIKGPLCTTDMIAWYVGSMPVYAPAHELALQHYRKHPGWAFRNPDIGVLEPNIRVHESVDAARASGLPAPYDVGVQRHQWAFQMLGDWASDSAFVKGCDVTFRGMNYFGDVTRINGTVVEKYVDDEGESVIKVDIRTTNQLDETTMPGSAVIALPTRQDAGQSPAERASSKRLDLDSYLQAEVPQLVRLPAGTTS